MEAGAAQVSTVHTRYSFEDGILAGIDIRLRQGSAHPLPPSPPPALRQSPADEPFLLEPVAAPAETAPEAPEGPVEATEGPEAVPMPLVLGEAPERPSRRERAAPAAVRGVKTFALSLAGMFAAGLAYVQEHLDSLSDINWTVVIYVVVGALVAALLYGLDRFYRPNARF